MHEQDTIAAIATPVGEGAVAIVRVSGPDAERIAAEIFVRSEAKNSRLASHRLYHGRIQDPLSAKTFDEVLLAIMRQPRSYTGEDVVELYCHGGVFVVRRVLELVLSRGARQAEPGEFTKRAFLNGRIDLAQAEATAFMIGSNLIEAVSMGRDPQPIGNAWVGAAPHDCYPCKGEDRWCVIAAESEEQWTALAQTIGSELAGDGRFATLGDRIGHREELNAIIARWTKSRDAFEVMDRLQAVGVPAGVVQTGEDLTEDPQLKARGFIVEVENARLGRVVLPNFPLQFANAKLTRRWEFPVLGKDTDAVLREVGLPPGALGWSLAAFNVGVELGQLAVVAVAVALLAAVRRYDVVWGERCVVAGSIGVIAAGVYWFAERVGFIA